jgi:hypothetical protein
MRLRTLRTSARSRLVYRHTKSKAESLNDSRISKIGWRDIRWTERVAIGENNAR